MRASEKTTEIISPSIVNRPYFNTQIDRLQALYESANGDQRLLKSLAYELRFRDKPKAKALKVQVDNTLQALTAVAKKSYLTPSVGTGYKHSYEQPLEPRSHPATGRVGVECAHCKNTNFVSLLDDVTQNLSCASCRVPYEAVFKYGVLRTQFEEIKIQKSQPSIASWFFIGALVLIVILLMVK